jgi:hypothetical protein
MKTIHLVYPHGLRISAPDAIGRNLGQRLEQCYKVVYYNVEDLMTIRPGLGDILVGHAMPSPFTCFRRSLKQPGWRRVILITPYAHGDPGNNAFINSFIQQCDLYLAITGNYWFGSIRNSIYAHWLPKMIHLDLAIERADFPVIKTQFNPPSHRRFVYIGIEKPQKNLGYLNQIARHLPETSIDWIGSGGTYSALRRYGPLDFAIMEARAMLQQYDFMITVGSVDANPTTILEGMSWGLIPVCTEQSGYTGYPGIINVPLNDVAGAVNLLQHLQIVPETQLMEMQKVNWQALDEHFNWDRFANQVIEAIESDANPTIEPISIRQRLLIRWVELVSSSALWRRPRHLSRVLLYKLRSAAYQKAL